MTVASIADRACGLATQCQDEAIGLVASLLNCLRGVRLRDFLPLPALKGPPLTVVEVGKYVDPSLATPSSPITMCLLYSGEPGNQFLAKRLKALPRQVGVVQWQRFWTSSQSCLESKG